MYGKLHIKYTKTENDNIQYNFIFWTINLITVPVLKQTKITIIDNNIGNI